MNIRGRKQGYTIVEVIVVLAVTSALVGSAFYFMSGRSRRLSFENDITAFQTKLDDVINNVSSGYYARTSDFACAVSSGNPVITSGISTGRGTNPDCQFLGRAIHTNTSWGYYWVHNIIGLRKVNGTGALISTYAESKARLLSLSTANNGGVEAAEMNNFYNTTLGKTRYVNTDGTIGTDDRGFLAFLSSLPSIAANGNANPGAQSVGLYIVNYATLPSIINLQRSKDEAVDAFVNGRSDSLLQIKTFQFCFDSKGSAQRGIVSVGEQDSDTKTTRSIEAGRCSAW